MLIICYYLDVRLSGIHESQQETFRSSILFLYRHTIDYTYQNCIVLKYNKNLKKGLAQKKNLFSIFFIIFKTS